MSRALRRHHLERMKAKAASIGRKAKEANHLAICSCHMCGNPRKWWKRKTFQEIRVSGGKATL